MTHSEKRSPFRVHKLVAFAFAAIFFSACTTVYFTEAQPANQTALKAFPKEFRGTYEFEGDTFSVLKNGYRYPEEFSKTILMSEIDTMKGIRLTEDYIYDDAVPTEQGIPYRISNDTLYYQTVLQLTTSISETFQLKKEGKYLVFSQKEEDEMYYTVLLLKKRSNGNIRIYSVGDFDEKIEKFFDITDFEKIGKRSYVVEPSRAEFQKLIKKGLFVKGGEFVKVD